MNLQITKKLNVIDGETLMDTRLPKRNFCVETLLPDSAWRRIQGWKVLDGLTPCIAGCKKRTLLESSY